MHLHACTSQLSLVKWKPMSPYRLFVNGIRKPIPSWVLVEGYSIYTWCKRAGHFVLTHMYHYIASQQASSSSDDHKLHRLKFCDVLYCTCIRSFRIVWVSGWERYICAWKIYIYGRENVWDVGRSILYLVTMYRGGWRTWGCQWLTYFGMCNCCNNAVWRRRYTMKCGASFIPCSISMNNDSH